AQFTTMKQAFPQHPETAFFEAQFAFAAKDFKTVRALTEQILKVTPDNVGVLQLAGAAELQMNSPLLAENHLGRALKLQPRLPMARNMLAQSYIRTGQPKRAVEVLQPALEKDGGGNATTASLLG